MHHLWVRTARLLRGGLPKRRSSGAHIQADAASRVETRLAATLEIVNTWLQFAEAKNVGIVALAALGITSILGYLGSTDSISRVLLAGILLTVFLLVISLSVSLLSFVPQTDPAKISKKFHGRPSDQDNLYFFGDLKKYRPEDLAQAVAKRYEGMQGYEPSQFQSHVDLASQIVVNSRIIVAKNAYFRVAAWTAIAALATAVSFTVLSLMCCR